MALPYAFDVLALTPTWVDTFQGYTPGQRVGLNAGLDKWHIASSDPGNIGTSGLNVLTSAHVAISESVTQAKCAQGLVGALTTIGTGLGTNHFVAAQCVVPMGVYISTPGVYPGVRVDSTTGDGYFFQNMGSTDGIGIGMWVHLYRRRAGVSTLLAQWGSYDGSTNDFIVDGIPTSDGFFAIMEVFGTNPVSIRCSIAAGTQWASWNNWYNRLSTFPTGIVAGVSGPPAAQQVISFDDYSAQRIVTGVPGVLSLASIGGDADNNGAILNVNAGPLPILTILADPVSSGSTTIYGDRKAGTTISVSGSASVGATSYPTSTTWQATVSSIISSVTLTATSSDGQTAAIVIGGIESSAQVDISTSLEFTANDLFTTARGLGLGRSWVAGPADFIDVPNDWVADTIISDISSASAFNASWTDQINTPINLNIDSTSQFDAIWPVSHSIGNILSISSDAIFIPAPEIINSNQIDAAHVTDGSNPLIYLSRLSLSLTNLVDASTYLSKTEPNTQYDGYGFTSPYAPNAAYRFRGVGSPFGYLRSAHPNIVLVPGRLYIRSVFLCQTTANRNSISSFTLHGAPSPYQELSYSGWTDLHRFSVSDDGAQIPIRSSVFAAFAARIGSHSLVPGARWLFYEMVSQFVSGGVPFGVYATYSSGGTPTQMVYEYAPMYSEADLPDTASVSDAVEISKLRSLKWTKLFSSGWSPGMSIDDMREVASTGVRQQRLSTDTNVGAANIIGTDIHQSSHNADTNTNGDKDTNNDI